MKQVLILLILTWAWNSTFSQAIQETFQIGGASKVKIVADYPDVKVKKGNSSEIQVSGEVVFNGVPVPDAMKLDWDSGTKTLTVVTDIDHLENLSEKEREAYMNKMDCEELKEMWLKQAGNNHHHNGSTILVQIEVLLPASISSLDIESTYGSIQLDYMPEATKVLNTYGSIDALSGQSFEEYKLESTYSSVTLEMPSNGKTDISLQSNYGDIYTDLDFSIDRSKSTEKQFKTIIIGALNNGGQNKITLRSDYSNVYLRKI